MTNAVTVTKIKLKLVRRDRRVSWADDVVDNEGLGKMKSNVCCIFCSKNKDKHKNKYERS
ncbi:protein phosphatase inhibitor [Ordospora colligata]|uniref:Type 1 phosphatases regulator n=1 Tax=Ordospora colligata OC4 TaxID=1354746 RepID=A0A0B2UNQ2_9MICR|nr:protein phosphatase inhibitor [Ordospora colligata OC4]KHN70585.1 protein phosphatase inhibitor [Ordospora colligata OC4]TBU17335.1 protein phosphatase inhibitor [Ordospora colligata]TBU17585.1 protein phosphatase inhibitor [Ordospora colligata]TBU19765.1 protein phosphatase inhibitor [Ordospora colligata]